ncbi:unnamed protein product [Moneuplotes crassus]|uniref:Uncharacterized protein n=1 Tax=Euplotes crassus TaxID=5936 RepID=A0AAD2D8I0_EUPCR|nr:unnamed protein product [Moneuplotes crassus]
MIQLLSMTQEHFEEFLGKEDTPSFAKNILRSCILEVFYQTQRHHEHINSNLDSNFFILFFNVIEDFQLQKDFLKYMKLFKTKSKLIENYSYPKLIISKFIEYQNLEELKYALQKPQKFYDETSLNFHIPNILTIYKNLCAVKCQVNSQLYEQAYKQIDKSDFYEYRNDLDCENFTHKMTNKPFKCAHSRTCKNSPFYFLPECDKTLCLTHRLERAYDQYSKFEPLHRCSFIGMAYLVENLQQYYFGLYSTHFSNAKKQTKQEAVLGIKQACYGLSFILREIICKCYCHSLDLRTRIGELNTTDKIVNILMSLLEKNEI